MSDGHAGMLGERFLRTTGTCSASPRSLLCDHAKDGATLRHMAGTCIILRPLNSKHGYPDNETGHDPRRKESEVPLPPDDEAPVEEELSDVDANNSVSSEHPAAGSSGRDDGPDSDPQMNDQDENKESRDLPASDPESGA